jgi:hypothetical protein
MKDISPEYSSEKGSDWVEPGGLSEQASGEGEGGQVLEAGRPSLGTRCSNFISHSLLAETNQLWGSWKTKIIKGSKKIKGSC